MDKKQGLLLLLTVIAFLSPLSLIGTDLKIGMGFERINDEKGIFFSIEPSLDFWQMHLTLGMNLMLKPVSGMLFFNVMNENPSQFFEYFNFKLWDFSYKFGKNSPILINSSVHPFSSGAGGNVSIYTLKHEDIFELNAMDSMNYWNFDIGIKKPFRVGVNSYIKKKEEEFAGELYFKLPITNELDLIPSALFDENEFKGMGVGFDYRLMKELELTIGSSFSPDTFLYNIGTFPVQSKFAMRMGVKYTDDILYFGATGGSFEIGMAFNHDLEKFSMRFEPVVCFKNEGRMDLSIYLLLQYEFIEGWMINLRWDTKDPVDNFKVWISAKIFEEVEESETNRSGITE